jgi:hypothetical protein
MLSDTINKPPLDLDKTSLHELMIILQNLLMILTLMFINRVLVHT